MRTVRAGLAVAPRLRLATGLRAGATERAFIAHWRAARMRWRCVVRRRDGPSVVRFARFTNARAAPLALNLEVHVAMHSHRLGGVSLITRTSALPPRLAMDRAVRERPSRDVARRNAPRARHDDPLRKGARDDARMERTRRADPDPVRLAASVADHTAVPSRSVITAMARTPAASRAGRSRARIETSPRLHCAVMPRVPMRLRSGIDRPIRGGRVAASAPSSPASLAFVAPRAPLAWRGVAPEAPPFVSTPHRSRAGDDPSCAAGAATVTVPVAPAVGGAMRAALQVSALDSAMVQRLTDDVIRRIDERVRIERERRGL